MKRVVPLARPGVGGSVLDGRGFRDSFARGPGEGEGLSYDVHQIAHMRREYTILLLEMNCQPLPELHGTPLRLRNELEPVFKQVKWIQAMELVSDFRHLGAGQGGFNDDHEYYGHRADLSEGTARPEPPRCAEFSFISDWR